jgi:hypothetical protein
MGTSLRVAVDANDKETGAAARIANAHAAMPVP